MDINGVKNIQKKSVRLDTIKKQMANSVAFKNLDNSTVLVVANKIDEDRKLIVKIKDKSYEID
ncbi:glycoside hydrolase family 30 beta sandwich domain-containing protein [Clostridium sardiniense]|uniref:glycoside hydrolase family 30 beta sandwich domain-containing protein n=1 Tax=Clostridium sardiniense TaxID=29369 RepID=UPI003D324F34